MLLASPCDTLYLKWEYADHQVSRRLVDVLRLELRHSILLARDEAARGAEHGRSQVSVLIRAVEPDSLGLRDRLSGRRRQRIGSRGRTAVSELVVCNNQADSRSCERRSAPRMRSTAALSCFSFGPADAPRASQLPKILHPRRRPQPYWSSSMPTLTNLRVDRASLPASGQTFVWCSQDHGFGVRLNASGTRTFVVQGRVDGRERRGLDRSPRCVHGRSSP